MNYRELADVLAKNAAVRVATSVADRLVNYIHASRWCVHPPVAVIAIEGDSAVIYTPLDYKVQNVENQVGDSHLAIFLGYRAVYLEAPDYKMILLCSEIAHDDE
jgi:hypothetical protein